MLYACAHVVLFPNQRPQSLVWERDQCTRKIARVEYGWNGLFSQQLPRLMSQVGRCLQLVTYTCTSMLIAMLRNSLPAALVVMQLPEYSCQFSCERKSAAQREVPCTESGWPFIRFQLANYVTHLFIYMLGTTIKLSMLFKFWGHSSIHKNTLLRVRSSCN